MRLVRSGAVRRHHPVRSPIAGARGATRKNGACRTSRRRTTRSPGSSIERGLAALYLVAFVVAWRQFPALCGERGLEPAPRLLEVVPRFLDAPTVFRWIGYSDVKLRAISAIGVAVSIALLAGLPQSTALPVDAGLAVTMLAWFVLWMLYQSIVNVGGSFYSFGWETLLLEAGFLAIFLGNGAIAPPLLVLFLYRWLAFRVEFGAGLIKLRGDRCWRDLTCMDFHHETQPMPNPLSWLFHKLPRRLHRAETIGNFVAQLVLPFGLLLPQPFATVAAVLMLLTQLYLVVSGNYAWLNWVTIVVMTAAIADPVLQAVVPGPRHRAGSRLRGHPAVVHAWPSSR